MTDQEIQDLIQSACGDRDDAIDRDSRATTQVETVSEEVPALAPTTQRRAGYIADKPAKYEGQTEANEHGEVFAKYSGVCL